MPYNLFGTNSEVEDYGTAAGERMGAGSPMKEYAPSHPAVPRKVMELLAVIKARGK